MSTAALESLTKFDWKPQPAAQKLVNDLAAEFLRHCPHADALAQKMASATGTRFVDWIDSIHAQATDDLRARLADSGWEPRPLPGAPEAFVNDLGMFPQIVLSSEPALKVAIKVEFVADFVAVWGLGDAAIDGDPLSQFRRAKIFTGPAAELWIAERHAYRAHEIPRADAVKGVRMLRHLEAFRARRRDTESDEQGFEILNALIDASIRDLGRDLTCDLFFAAEREYWERRNRAARVQKARQDTLGLGWANHDHHTYRSSRRHFGKLIGLWEKLGFFARERFYAGAEAGWGAQVMEHATTGIITFNDVDMSPDELLGDFAHQPMEERDSLGTVGLWCALHGEAVLQAGMHHLEAMFDWHALKGQLAAEAGIKTMDPFTTFPFLRQAFTEGERWPVSKQRVATLLAKGLITREQAEQFTTNGAIGSHLENLERNDGFKGFNQQGVSDIIARTDPRRLAALAPA